MLSEDRVLVSKNWTHKRTFRGVKIFSINTTMVVHKCIQFQNERNCTFKWVHFIICKLHLNKSDLKIYISPLHYTLDINWLTRWLLNLFSHYNCLTWVFITANTTKTIQGKWNRMKLKPVDLVPYWQKE